MWKTLYQSVQGTSHQRTGKPCQDNCAAREIQLADDSVLILACSDGAGSEELSQVGSRLACDTIVDLIAAEMRLGERLTAIAPERAGDWLGEVHGVLCAEADGREVDVRRLACTLLFAALGRSGAAFGQVGDGAIVVWQDGKYQTIFWPQSGEYANTTNFITNSQCRSFLEFAWCAAPVDEVAMFTDGLQTLGLSFADRQAHGPFFAPLFASLRKQPSADDLIEPMRAFLESPELAERTDDDKTLILATRVAN